MSNQRSQSTNYFSRFWWLWLLIIVIVISISILLGYFLKPKTNHHNTNTSATDSAQIEPVELPPDPLRPVNILLLGYGGAGHDGGSLTDSIILAQIVPHDQKAYLLNIPRDLWVSVEETDGTVLKEAKINTIFAHGGGELAKKAISEIIAEPIDYFVAVDFAGFKNGLNILTGSKGLEVDAPFAFTDYYYPLAGEEDNPCDFSEDEIASLSATLSGYLLEQQFTCRYETISYAKGKQLMSADQALKFVRSRHSGIGGGDFGRSQRQQAFIQAVKDKVLTLGILPKAPALWSEYKKNVTTDLDLELVTRALSNWGDLTQFQTVNMVISNQNVLQDSRSYDGQYILLPQAGDDDYSEIQEFIDIHHQGLDWETYQENKEATANATQSATTSDELPAPTSTPNPTRSELKTISSPQAVE